MHKASTQEPNKQKNVHVRCEHAEHLRLTSLYLEARRSWTSWALSFERPEPRGDLLLQRPRTSTFLQAAASTESSTDVDIVSGRRSEPADDLQTRLIAGTRTYNGGGMPPPRGKCGSSGQRSDEKSLRWLSAGLLQLSEDWRHNERTAEVRLVSSEWRDFLSLSDFTFIVFLFIHFLSNFLFHLSGHGFTSCFWASPFLWMSSSGSPVSEPRLQLVLPSCCIFVWILLCLRSLEADGA